MCHLELLSVHTFNMWFFCTHSSRIWDVNDKAAEIIFLFLLLTTDQGSAMVQYLVHNPKLLGFLGWHELVPFSSLLWRVGERKGGYGFPLQEGGGSYSGSTVIRESSYVSLKWFSSYQRWLAAVLCAVTGVHSVFSSTWESPQLE